MKKILTIGGAMRDIFIQYEHVETLNLDTAGKEQSFLILEQGRKVEVDKLVHYTGGGAANSAVSCARLGFSVESFFKVGTDQEGDAIVQALEKENVSINHVLRSKQVATGTSFIIPGPEGNRTVLVYRGANLTIQENELPRSAMKNTDQIYVTSLSGPAAKLLVPIAKIAKEYGKPIAVNPGTSQLKAGPTMLKAALENIDILILNGYEAQLLMTSLTTMFPKVELEQKKEKFTPNLLRTPLGPSTTCFTLPQFFHEVISHGPQIVIVTDGAEGVYVAANKKIYFHPSLKTTIVSTIGAGDAFGSCFVAQLTQGKSVENALRCGIINSTSVIEYLDTQTGLLHTNELEKRLKELDQSYLKTFTL